MLYVRENKNCAQYSLITFRDSEWPIDRNRCLLALLLLCSWIGWMDSEPSTTNYSALPQPASYIHIIWHIIDSNVCHGVAIENSELIVRKWFGEIYEWFATFLSFHSVCLTQRECLPVVAFPFMGSTAKSVSKQTKLMHWRSKSRCFASITSTLHFARDARKKGLFIWMLKHGNVCRSGVCDVYAKPQCLRACFARSIEYYVMILFCAISNARLHEKHESHSHQSIAVECTQRCDATTHSMHDHHVDAM